MPLTRPQDPHRRVFEHQPARSAPARTGHAFGAWGRTSRHASGLAVHAGRRPRGAARHPAETNRRLRGGGGRGPGGAGPVAGGPGARAALPAAAPRCGGRRGRRSGAKWRRGNGGRAECANSWDSRARRATGEAGAVFSPSPFSRKKAGELARRGMVVHWRPPTPARAGPTCARGVAPYLRRRRCPPGVLQMGGPGHLPREILIYGERR